MINDSISILNQFAREVTARALDTMELASCNEKTCQAVRKGIYALRDSFVLKIKNGEACYEYKNS